MTSGPDEPRPGPVARLLGSLANALIDLGLPTIRDWLRERLGPASDVGQVTTDGAFVHLDSVRVPIGPRGLLVLERATAAITGVGRAGLPEIRLHAFTGVLGFGHGTSPTFRAEVSFTAAPDPEEAAWIWGELAIRNASWSERAGSPHTNPMNGIARLFVSSREWRLDGGRLDGEIVRARFAGGGIFEQARSDEPEEVPLVPPALSTFALSLEHARVGPFVDAASALAGQAIAIPSFVPLDAALDGDLAWRSGGSGAGGSADLRVASEAIRARLHGVIGPTGRGLSGRIDADVRPASLLRAGGTPREALPRDEDVVRIELQIGGDLRHPQVKGTLQSPELGFRLGRPRFVPAVVLRGLESEIFIKNDRAVLRAVAHARSGKVTIDGDGNLRELTSMRGTLRAEVVDAAFLRDIVATLGARVVVPNDLAGSVDFTLVPTASGRALDGKIGLATATSKLELAITPAAGMRVTGGITARDAVATGLFGGAVFPSEGELVVGLDVFRERGRVWAHGTVGATRLALAIKDRPEIPPYVLEGAAAEVAIDHAGLVYGQLRFRGHGGRFIANGAIPFTSERAPERPVDDREGHHNPPLLVLELEEGSAELGEALARFARGVQIRAGRDEARPPEELWLPADLTARGHLRLDADLSLTADLNLGTPAGTALVLALQLRHGQLDGSTLVGRVSLTDALRSGALGTAYEADGIVAVNALVARQGEKGPIVLVTASAERLVAVVAGATFVATNVAAALRFDAEQVAWNALELSCCSGTLTSAGTRTSNGVLLARVSLSQVAVHELPAISGRAPASFVRGRLSGSVIGRTDVSRSLRASGDVMLEDAAFPALDLVRPTLARYGLRPPNEDAAAPVTATVVGSDWGLTLRDVKLDLRGATVRGEMGVSRERVVEAEAEVTLEEEYLRTSKLLTLPRVLSDHLVIPIRVRGPLDNPQVHAGLGQSLEHFLKDNRVSAFVTSAVEEAQILLGRPRTSDRPAAGEKERRAAAPELDAELRQELAAHAADWDVLARRRTR